MLIPDAWAPYATLAILAGTFAMFVRERQPPEMVALCALGAVLALGVLTPDQAFDAMANPAPVTIACMFVLSRALVRVGLLDAVSDRLSRDARERPRATLAAFGVAIVAASALINNTPIVVIMIPIAIRLAAAMEVAPSKLLIPVSYCAILGGVCTMIGTSTNLIVDGVARQHGLEAFSLFEITPLGLALAVAGLAYLAVAGPALLPDRQTPGRAAEARRSLRFMTELVVPEGSTLIGRRLEEIEELRRDGLTVIDVIRVDESLRRDLGAVVLDEGDRIVLRTGVNALVTLRNHRGFKMMDRVSQRGAVTAEVLVTPGSAFVARSLGKLRLRRRYGVYPVAVHRRGALPSSRLDAVILRVGDTLMLEGDPADVQRMAEDADLVVLSQRAEKPFRRGHAPLVAAVFCGIVALSAFDVAPIATLSILGVVVVLLSRALDPEEAYAAVDGRLLALILCMLALGAAMERTGALTLVVDALTPLIDGASPIVVLFLLVALTSLLTEALSNNAVAIVMTPLAISLAQSLGLDPRPFVVGVMAAASSSFATPIGYQTNTLIYAPGGYRFADYVRIGTPLNVIVCIVATLVIPLIWPLAPAG